MKAAQRRAVRTFLVYKRCPSCHRMGQLSHSARDGLAGCSNCGAAFSATFAFGWAGTEKRGRRAVVTSVKLVPVV